MKVYPVAIEKAERRYCEADPPVTEYWLVLL